MTRTKKFAAAALIATGAMIGVAGPAGAAPVTFPAPTPGDIVVDVLPGISYTAYTNGVGVLRSVFGMVALTPGGVQLIDANGNLIFE